MSDSTPGVPLLVHESEFWAKISPLVFTRVEMNVVSEHIMGKIKSKTYLLTLDLREMLSQSLSLKVSDVIDIDYTNQQY